MVGKTFAARYELEELVGSGGMSSVYRAHDSLLERYVALKILHDQYAADDEFVERFKREARAAAQLSHPNIVTVIDRGEDGGRQFIVFEYIDGENLKERLVRSGRLPVRDALELALQIARGLSFAHEHGLVHRDVKPQNVLLNGDGRAKVTDFGIARSVEVDGMTQTGTVLGTSNYIAPEQASGQPVDAQTDVYALGVVLYELLAGDVPFPGDNFVAVALKHVNQPPPSISEVRDDVAPRVAAAIDRALEKDPARRFPGMSAFAAELEACLVGLDLQADTGSNGAPTGIVAPASQPSQPSRPRRRVSPWAIVLLGIALAALAAVVVGFVALRSHDSGTVTVNSPVLTSVPLTAVGTYDPFGDDHEHDEQVPASVDGNAATYWSTEHYQSFDKPGVGLVLGAGSAADQITRVTIQTTTPGFHAQLRTGASLGTYHAITPDIAVSSSTTFRVDAGRIQRYLVLWITSVPIGYVQVNEVKAR